MTMPLRTSSFIAIVKRSGPLVGLVAVFALFVMLQGGALPTLADLQTVAVQSVIVSIVGIAMTLIILSGGIDLSVGSMLALSSVVAALSARAGWPLPFIIAAACISGFACGLYNGALISLLRLPPFIVTLGTLGFFRGVSKWIADSRVISGPNHGLDMFVRPTPVTSWMLFAPAVWLALAVALSIHTVLSNTVWGRKVTAIGSNELAATFAGIPINGTRMQVYGISGFLVGIAGVLQFGRLTVGDPTIAIGLELDAVAAAVIGGASLSGGRGSIFGAVCGAVMMAYLRNRCTAIGWPNFVQEIIVGHIILLAVALDFARRNRLRDR